MNIFLNKKIKALFLSLVLAITFFGLVEDSFAISIYPADILDLKAVSSTESTITLTWTAPGDDEFVGYADHYDMRVSGSGISPLAWDLYDSVSGLPTPGDPGLLETFTVTGLTASTTYYFAVKGVDVDGNTSQNFVVTSYDTLAAASSQNVVSNLNFLPKLDYGNPISKLFEITIFEVGTSNSVLTFSQNADNSGKVILPSSSSLTSGIYDIGVSSEKYLSKKTMNVNMMSDSNINLTQINSGDVNSDGIINSLDWSLLSSNWFTSNASYDLNGDNFINSLDWSIVSKNWFLTGDF